MTTYGLYDAKTHTLIKGGFECMLYAENYAARQGFAEGETYAWEEARR